MTVDYQSCLNEGMTARGAALACGVTLASVRNWASRHGVSWRQHVYEAMYDLPEGVADLPPLAECDLDPVACRGLWASVLRDQWFSVFGGQYSDTAALQKREAEAWFGGRDCAMVCALAGVEFGYVMLKYRRKRAEAAGGSAGAVIRKRPFHVNNHRPQAVTA